MEEFIRIANSFGLPWAALFLILLVLGRTLKAVVSKMLNDEVDGHGRPKGLLDKVVNKHVATMEVVQENVKAQTALLLAHEKILMAVHEEMKRLLAGQADIKENSSRLANEILEKMREIS